MRFRFGVCGDVAPRTHAPEWSPNRLRGAFGKALRQLDRNAYERYFAPHAISRDESQLRPSGFADPPRPFVFRVRDLACGSAGINLFITREPLIDLFTRTMERIGFAPAGEPSLVQASLDPAAENASKPGRVRVHFLTPTELKGANQPDFGILLARIRDRISTLRALYGSGPLEMEFKAFGARASRVTMTRCELARTEDERVSKRTGQRHPIDGFVGIAEYEGDLAEFLPYLELARQTGVGRQTVWGKGEIAIETF